MRILFVTNRWPSDASPGDSPALQYQAEAIRKRGHTVDILHFDTSKSRLNYLRGAASLVWNAALRGRYDLIHAHYGHLVGWIARLQWRCPVVVTYRGSDLLWERQYRSSRPLSRFVDGVIVMTEPMRDLLELPEAVIIPYGIDGSVFRPGSLELSRRMLDLPSEAPLVLFPFDPNRRMKRFDLVAGAMELVRDVLSDAELVTISDEPPERVAAYMAACDVMVLTSDREGAPVSVREAIACGLPIVSVDVGDVKSLIDGLTHCFVVGRSVDEIADKLITVLAGRPRSDGPTRGAAVSAEAAADQVLEVYSNVMVARAARSRGSANRFELERSQGGGTVEHSEETA